MESFKTFLHETAKVTALKHLYHPEELVFTEGSSGVKSAISFIQQTINALFKTKSGVRISRKWDGAPSTVFGYLDGKFFVGSKSVFNADPKINYTIEDILENHGHAAGLVRKLRFALEHLPKVTPNNGLIYQGDFLFDDGDVKSKKIGGSDAYVFAPNTITYAVDKSSPLGGDIAAAKMGIVVHTYYDSLDSAAKFLPDLKGFKKSKDVFIVDAEVDLGPEDVMLSPGEYKSLTQNLREIEAYNKRLEGTGFYSFLDSKIATMVLTYNNTLIREGKKVVPEKGFDGLMKFIESKLDKEISKLKSDAGRARKTAEKDKTMSLFRSQSNNFVLSYKIYNDLMDTKDILVNKFNNLKKFGTFIDNGSTFVPTNDEGFVIVGDSGVVKLVDRFEFSRQNFNMSRVGK